MRLYYVTSTKWAKVTLADQRLKLSFFPSVNDPFELLGGALGEGGCEVVGRLAALRTSA